MTLRERRIERRTERRIARPLTVIETLRLRCHNCSKIFYSEVYQLECDDCVPHWGLPIVAACLTSLWTILVVAVVIYGLRGWR
jgi:hypothetical protein